MRRSSLQLKYSRDPSITLGPSLQHSPEEKSGISVYEQVIISDMRAFVEMLLVLIYLRCMVHFISCVAAQNLLQSVDWKNRRHGSGQQQIVGYADVRLPVSTKEPDG